jgi:hypothetical protein
MVAYNSNEGEKDLNINERFAERTDGFAKGKNVFNGEDVDLHKAIKILGKGTMVIELEK